MFVTNFTIDHSATKSSSSSGSSKLVEVFNSLGKGQSCYLAIYLALYGIVSVILFLVSNEKRKENFCLYLHFCFIVKANH